MNYYTNPFDDFRKFFRKRSVLSSLILVNCGIWVLSKALGVIFFLFNQPGSSASDDWILTFFALPADIGMLSLKPWALVTYMFLHLDFFHILFNMLWLYWFGRIFLEYLNYRQLLITYLLGGITGGLIYIFAFNVFPVFHSQLPASLALGASASVMAIVMAISFYVPNYTINLLLFGRVKILYLAIILFIFDFFAIPGANSGGHIAHIGGALWGLFFAMSLKKGYLPFLTASGNGWSGKWKTIFGNSQRDTSGKNKIWARPKTDDEYNTEKLEKQKRTDSILEKISKGGYDSLSKDEKEFLFRSSGKKN